MEGANLIEFDEVALAHDAALLDLVLLNIDEDDDEILIGDGTSVPDTTSSAQTDQVCSSSTLILPPDAPAGGEVFVVVESRPPSPFSIPLPPAVSIRPPRPPPTTHLPPPEVSSNDEPEDIFGRWHRRNGRLCMGIGISQIVAGTVCVALAIASVLLRVNLYMINHGMWGGITLITCGVVGVLASRQYVYSRVVFYMTISIIASFGSAAVFSISIAGCADVNVKSKISEKSCVIGRECNDSTAWLAVSLAIHLVMGLVAMVGLTLTLISVGITSRLVWLVRRHRPTNENLPHDSLQFSRSPDGSVVADFTANFRFRDRPPDYSPAEPPPSYSAVTDRPFDDVDK